MIELKVTVDAPELSVAINHLADAIESKGTDAPAAPVKNSRSKKATAKTAPDAPAVSAPAHSEPVGSPVPVEQPAAAPQPVQAPAAAPVQQAAAPAPQVEEGIPGDVVAAIMAAIHAMGNGKYTLKAVRRAANGWSKAGVNDTTAPF